MAMALPLLAGDVGGTNTRLSMLSSDGKKTIRSAVLKSREHATLEAAVREFLGNDKVRAACLGIAGPVLDGKCNATNLPWVVDERSLERKLRIGRVRLLNDLVAAAYGCLTVPRSKLVRLWGDKYPTGKGNVAIIAAGTGLGEAALVRVDDQHRPLATEGGHTDFAARDDLEARLFAHLRKKLASRVSYERVVSGPGIGNIYGFLVESEGMRETDANRRFLAAAADHNAALTELAVAKRSKPAARALSMFFSLYGAEAGNLALKTLPTGGLFVAGGIAAKLREQLMVSDFITSFFDKGRMRPLLRSIPVALVLDSDVGLKGSALVATKL